MRGVQLVEEILVAGKSLGIGAGLWGKGHRRTSQRDWYPRCISMDLACSIRGERGEKMPPYPIMHALLSQ